MATPNTHRSVYIRNLMVAAAIAVLDAAKIRVYTGAQPATPESVATGTLLAELTMGTPAFAAPVAGVAAANSIAATVGLANGDAGWFRIVKADGTTAVADGSCGTSNANMILVTLAVTTGGAFSVGSLTWTEAMQGS